MQPGTRAYLYALVRNNVVSCQVSGEPITSITRSQHLVIVALLGKWRAIDALEPRPELSSADAARCGRPDALTPVCYRYR